MTSAIDPADEAINNARALLDSLNASDWNELHVVSGDLEIFLARSGGRANPMLGRQPAAATAAAEQFGPETSVVAAHVATLVDAQPVGTVVSSGDTVATIRVLDEEAAVLAPHSGTVVRLDAVPGALLEYNTPILSIAAAA